MKFELSHDTIARAIYERASTEDKLRLKILGFIRSRYQFYLDNKNLLTKEDLSYIDQGSRKHLHRLDLRPEERAFVDKSRKAVANKIFWKNFLVGSIIIILAALAIWAVASRAKVEEARASLKRSNDENRVVLDSLRKVKRRVDSLAQTLEKGEGLLQISEKEKEDLIKQLVASRDSLEQALETVTEENVTLKARARTLEAQTQRGGSNKLKEQIEKREKELKNREASLRKSQSRILSSKAHYALDKDKNPKLAFQLAREAYEMDPTNTEATTMLNQVVNSRNDYIGQSNSPKRRADQIIRTYKARYGKLTNAAKKRALGSN